MQSIKLLIAWALLMKNVQVERSSLNIQDTTNMNV